MSDDNNVRSDAEQDRLTHLFADAALGRLWREAINMERAQWAVDQWVATGDETPLHEAGIVGSFLCLLRAELRKERP